jgi:hypothetical protein
MDSYLRITPSGRGCPKCLEWTEDWGKDRTRSDGVAFYCKNCNRERSRYPATTRVVHIPRIGAENITINLRRKYDSWERKGIRVLVKLPNDVLYRWRRWKAPVYETYEDCLVGETKLQRKIIYD